MKHFAVFALMCAPLSAQFENLTTNHDGSVLYFSSKLRQRGAVNQNQYFKSFVADDAGIRLHVQRDYAIMPPEYVLPVSTYYSVEAVEVSGDNRVQAVTARRDCFRGSGCIPVSRWETTITRPGAPVRTLASQVSLSRNGRYALVCCDGSLIYMTSLMDLETGQSRSGVGMVRTIVRGRPAVSSGGVAVAPELSGEALLVSPMSGEPRRIPTAKPLSGCTIDDQARVAACSGGTTLVLVDLETGAQIDIAGSVSADHALSADAQTLAYRSKGQLYIRTVAGTRPLRLDAPVTNFVLSGDGRVIYAETDAGALIRLNLVTGETRPIVDRSLQIKAVSEFLVPGSMFRIAGSGFGAGVTVTIGGQTAPVISASEAEIVSQVPWNAPPGPTQILADAASSHFELEPFQTSLYSFMPQFITPAGWEDVAAVHENWSALVNASRPATPGEIVHFYMTGLGPVEPTLPDGAVTPIDALYRTAAPIECVFQEALRAPALFAGLAPGMIGLYQVSVRIPEEVVVPDYGRVPVRCSSPGVTGYTANIRIAPR